ncbi:choice-of-anchor D domain-containing protein, partial [Microcoleus sp. Z1_C3]
MEQISQALANQSDIEAIHILSHGSPGSLSLGSDTINNQNLTQFSNEIQQWGKALTKNADILLYGCEVAAGETGLQFIENLHLLTGANIAASNNKTGNKALGGDWELEVKLGEIEIQSLNVPNYSYTLAPTGAADNKALLVSGTPTSTKIDVLANDIGIGRLNVQSIVTAPTNGTAIINDWIYVGGNFTNIGGLARNYIARLNSDGTVDNTFNPNPDFSVWAIAIDSSGNPIVGGDFRTIGIGGQPRNRIAKLNPTTGAADATFNPDSSGPVYEIAIDSSGNPIVGGFFSTIGGQTRNGIAKLDPTTGVADATFTPEAQVGEIAIDSSGNLIVGGSFGIIGGQPRNKIAKLDPTTGVADATFNPNATFNPSVSARVNAIAIDSSGNLIVGGSFDTISGQPRNYIAKLNPTTGVADGTFNPNANNEVNAIVLDSSGNPIVGGYFSTIGGQPRNGIAKLDPTTGAADATFNPNANSVVFVLALDSSGNPIVGGGFTTIGGQTRNRIAKLNPTTGAADATFNPNANNPVRAITFDSGREILYTPNANFNGIDTFTYTANDSTGPSTPITVTVLVNNSPVLDTSGTPTLTAQNQGDSASTGTLVSTIIANLGGTKITDPNTAASQGIAITGLDTANGSWQYTINGGTTWTNTPAVSATNALLLASNANTRIRFVPNATYNGTVANAITFAAWDQIVGTNGSTANYTADLATNTTSSVFSSATETANITVNVPPTITSVTPVANGTYGVGQNLDFTVTFSQAVTITQGTGSAILPITLDTGGTVNATLVGTGTSNTTQTFRYTVASGNLDTNGIAVGTALTLSGGATIQNAATANAILTLNSVGATTGVLVDGVLPTVTSITSNTTNGSYTVGQIIPITVQFSEPVTVTGIPQLTLATGGAGTPINYASGSGTNTLTFNYTVATGHTSADLDYLSTAALALNGGTIQDAATNNATLTLPTPATANSLGANKAIVIDTTAPTVTIDQATAQTDPTTTSPINFTVTFSEPVTGFDATDIDLTASTASGTLTPTITGSGPVYTVAVNGITGSGNVIASIKANGVTDTAGNQNFVSTSTDNSVTYNAPAPEIQVLDGTTDIVDGTTSAIDFGSVTVGATLNKTFTVKNLGTAVLNLSNLTLPTGFSLVGNLPATLAADASANVQVQVDTTAAGNKTGTLQFVNNDSDENPFNFPISASVTATPVPEIQVLDGATDIVDGTESTIDFGNVTVGGTLNKTFTVKNLGTAVLNLSNPTLPTGFSLVGNLPTTLAAGASANLQVQVDTATAGNKTGTLQFVNNDSDENPFDFPIAASVTTAPLPEIQVLDGTTDIVDGTTSAIDFGSVIVGTTLNKNFTVKNLGTAVLNLSNLTLPTGFSLVGTLPATVAAGGTTNLQVQVDTATAGNKTGTLQFVNDDSDENPFDFPISASVTATPLPEIQVLDGTTDIVDGTASTIDFGSATIGGTLNKTFTVKNLGTAVLNLSNLTLPTGFSIVGTLPATVAAGASANVQVQVDTATAGNKTGTLQFVNDDSDENPFDFPISASVTATPLPEIQVLDGTTDIVDGTASTIDFGSATIGGTLNKTFTVKNLGTAVLNLSNLTLPTGFSIVGTLPATVAAGASANVQVQVDTATAGNKTGTLQFVNNDSDENPFDFPISASVTATPLPEIQVLDGTTDIVDGTESTIDFGSVIVGTTLNKNFTVKNLGTAVLNLSNLTLPTGFSIVGTLPATVAAGASANVQVQVDTATAGNKTGTLQFVNNDSDENPFDFPISASVTATPLPEIQVLDGTTDIVDGTESTIDFGSVIVGTTLNKTFTVKNLGTAVLNLSNLTLPTGFSLVGNLPATVAAGASANVQVQVDTTAAGNKTGTLQFVNNDSDENPFNFPISASVTATPVPEIQVLDGTTDIVDGTTSAIDFGSVIVGTTLNKTFTVKNLGTAVLNLSNLTLPTGFSIVGTLPATVAAGGTTNLQVQVDTTAAGNKSGTLQFVNDDSDENPFDFPIAATVTTAPTPTLTPTPTPEPVPTPTPEPVPTPTPEPVPTPTPEPVPTPTPEPVTTPTPEPVPTPTPEPVPTPTPEPVPTPTPEPVPT